MLGGQADRLVVICHRIDSGPDQIDLVEVEGSQVDGDGLFKDAYLDNLASNPDQIKQESNRLVKYFLAAMTIPQDDLWVNLSPYEENRIIPDELGKTARDHRRASGPGLGGPDRPVPSPSIKAN